MRLRCRALFPFLLLVIGFSPAIGWRPWRNQNPNATDLILGGSKKYEGSSDLIHLKYHMGPVLTSNITVYPIWYGRWGNSQKRIIRDFIISLSAADAATPSLAAWWKTAQLYTDQTGARVSRHVRLGAEKNDRLCSHGKSLTRLSVQSDFCNNICGFHYFTFPSIVGYTLPYAWVGNSAKLCPGTCAYPFAVPDYIPGLKAVKPPNGDVGVDGMVSVIGHEIAELSTNPLVNAWYAGQDPVFPVEIADLCEGIYGTGGGGSYTGQMLAGKDGATYNVNGVRRRFLVQWLWSHVLNYCTGPNALDQ
nr:protein EXORDIUM-like 3 [Ipomoea batatas]GME05313.1 protein EXORDIUM-like 3 [Ipomoea batatas]